MCLFSQCHPQVGNLIIFTVWRRGRDTIYSEANWFPQGRWSRVSWVFWIIRLSSFSLTIGAPGLRKWLCSESKVRLYFPVQLLLQCETCWSFSKRIVLSFVLWYCFMLYSGTRPHSATVCTVVISALNELWFHPIICLAIYKHHWKPKGAPWLVVWIQAFFKAQAGEGFL